MIFLPYRRPARLLLSAALLLLFTPVVHAGPLLTQDFNGAKPWPKLAALPVAGVTVKAAYASVGTIDVANSTTPSGAVLLTARNAQAKSGVWTAGMTSGLLPVRTTETNIGKLTLSFDHSVSSVRPVTVRIESFNAKRVRTGGREGVVYPAAPNFYLRAALELSTMHPYGAGAFRPTDPFVRLTFAIQSASGETQASTELRIDNVCYASPAFYVSPTGKDTNDGRTEKTPFADPQKAVDAAQPGDIILLMNGTYHRPPNTTVQNSVIDFVRGGKPAAWIVVKNYPGQHPNLTSDGWNIIKIGRGGAGRPVTADTLCYLEMRGLHIRGIGDTIRTTHPELIDKVDPLTNGNGISGSGGNEFVAPHHIRIADNMIEYCAGGGVGSGDCDYVTIENNIIRNNCWTTIYANSGISTGERKHFDAVDNVYKTLIRNNVVSGNRCYEKWRVKPPRFSDGNGIIVDTNFVPAKNQVALGRTLIQGNLTFNNGGSGIHVFRGHRVDIVNNTAYYNGATPELRWGQIFVQLSDDVHFMNNILVSRPGQPINSVGPGGGDQNSTNVTRSNNIYFGGLPPKITGPDDIIADPQFVNASTDVAVANFHVKAGSPALKSGTPGALVPLRDLDGKPRPVTGAPDRGAYQK